MRMSWAVTSCLSITGNIQLGVACKFTAVGQIRYWGNVNSYATLLESVLTRITFVNSQVEAKRTGRDVAGRILFTVREHQVGTVCASSGSEKPSKIESTSISAFPKIWASFHPVARRSRFIRV
jgi:hypothetical protein